MGAGFLAARLSQQFKVKEIKVIDTNFETISLSYEGKPEGNYGYRC
jgi:16S rRNA G1207 methylase RsmC